MINQIANLTELCLIADTKEKVQFLNYHIKKLTNELKKQFKLSVDDTVDSLEPYADDIKVMMQNLELVLPRISIKTTYHHLFLIIKEIITIIKYRIFISD